MQTTGFSSAGERVAPALLRQGFGGHLFAPECALRMACHPKPAGQRMVELDETISNQLFQTLADWNDQLKDAEEIIHTDKIGGPQP